VSAKCEPGLLSAVIVHYRGRDDLERCVESLQRQDFLDIEIILVDNGSTDGAVDAVVSQREQRTWKRPVRVVRCERNKGFAAGANAGLAAARGELLLLLNPDAEVERRCLSELASVLDAGADIATPRVLLRDRPGYLDNCGHDLYPDGLNWCRGRGERAGGRYLAGEEVLLFSGAAVLIRRSALSLLGGLDPRYFGYGEDADLSLRAARAGLRCTYVPSAVVHHAVGGSFGALSLHKVFLVERNRLRVAVTHLPASWLFASPLWTAARLGMFALRGARGQGLAGSWAPRQRMLLPLVVFAAQGAGVLDLPGSIARRRSAQRLVADLGGLSPSQWRSRVARHRVGLAGLARRSAGV
jgi:GT2 family glycosyltransferase